jgi:hypothetical protein
MAGEDNVEFLREGGRRYIVGTAKTSLRKFERELLAEDWRLVHEGLEVRITPAPGGKEVFILCRSAERRVKEQAMHERFEKRIEEGLGKIQTSCQKKKQKPVTIATRVGRLLGRNTRAAALFDVKVEADAGGFARLRWSKVEAWREWARLSEGCYMLRSNVTDWSPEDLWRAYIQLTEAEAAFHVHKSDLAIRPVWHQKEQRVQAHILVCFLTYVLWKTLAAGCRQAGLGDEPRQVFEALSEIALVDVALPTRAGTVIRKRCISQPTEHQQILLQRLGLKLPTALELSQLPQFPPADSFFCGCSVDRSHIKQDCFRLFSAPVTSARSERWPESRVVKTYPLENATAIRRIAVCTCGAATGGRTGSVMPIGRWSSLTARRAGRGSGSWPTLARWMRPVAWECASKPNTETGPGKLACSTARRRSGWKWI